MRWLKLEADLSSLWKGSLRFSEPYNSRVDLVVLLTGHLYFRDEVQERVKPLKTVLPAHLKLMPWKRFPLGTQRMYPLHPGTLGFAILSFRWHRSLLVNAGSMKFMASSQTDVDSSLQKVPAGQTKVGPIDLVPSHNLTRLFRSHVNPY